MIGNAEDAVFIHNWYHGDSDDLYANRERRWSGAPDGWTRLGEGCYRVGFLSPSGVVYKVQQYLGKDSWQSNAKEWETWKRLYLTCKMPKYSRLPKLSYYPIPGQEGIGVIAIEKLVKNGSSFPGRTEKDGSRVDRNLLCDRISRATGVGDLYFENVRYDESENVLVPTDLAG